jgi:hypothetical protein
MASLNSVVEEYAANWPGISRSTLRFFATNIVYAAQIDGSGTSSSASPESGGNVTSNVPSQSSTNNTSKRRATGAAGVDDYGGEEKGGPKRRKHGPKIFPPEELCQWLRCTEYAADPEAPCYRDCYFRGFANMTKLRQVGILLCASM